MRRGASSKTISASHTPDTIMTLAKRVVLFSGSLKEPDSLFVVYR